MTKFNKDSILEEFPNALAHLKVSTSDFSIDLVDTFDPDEHKDKRPSMARRRSNKKDDELARAQNLNPDAKPSRGVEKIWKHMGMNDIDISYACVGFTLDSGRPILDYDEFVNLLINYGFAVQDVVVFINDFAKNASENNIGPIVMMSANSSRIISEVTPLKKV